MTVSETNEILRGLRDASDGWSDDACCISAEAGEAGAVLIERLTAALSEQVVPNPAAQFVMWALLNGSWQGADIDGGAAQDRAVELGLIAETTYDPSIHGESDHSEPGDTWYVPSETLLAMLPAPPPVSPAGESRMQIKFNPANCPHCEYDRRFPDFEGGGWMQQDNNGPIVSCPLCNDDGSHPPTSLAGDRHG